MVGALTTAVAQKARSSLVVAGLALGVAALVAFLPMGAGADSTSTPDRAADESTSSFDAIRGVFSQVALAATMPPETTTATSPTEVAGAPASAVETPTAPPAPDQALSETTVRSALQAVTAIPTVAPAITVPTIAVPTRTVTPAPAVTATLEDASEGVATAAPQAYTSSMPSLQAALAESPWPPELWPTVERIVMCESSGNPAAHGPGGYVGLMQVSPSLHGAVPPDAVSQLAQGYEVYLKQGWGAWGCY